MGEVKKVFITVKAYPHPSNTYGELVCAAGIFAGTQPSGEGEFRRIGTIPQKQAC
jgi:hypothetical protein